MTSEHQKHPSSNHQKKEDPHELEKAIEKREENPTSTIALKQRHKEFVRALEEYGSQSSICDNHSSSRCWEQMSLTLGWSVQEVKVYAYRYFVLLQQHNESKIAVTRPVTPLPESPLHSTTATTSTQDHPYHVSIEKPSNSQFLKRSNCNIDDWTEDDRILMDTLLVAYEGVDHHNLLRQETKFNLSQQNASPQRSKADSKKTSVSEEFKWEQIAAMLPGKTADDVKRRYMALNRHR